MRKLTLLPLLVLVAATSGGATDCGQIIDDSGFDLWCGESLCRWRVEKGEVGRATTWHEGDIGVELIGSEVSISQISEVTSDDGHCVAFDLVADIADDAQVRLQMDVFGDTSTELDEPLPSADWRGLSYRVRMPDFYQGVRFRLVKYGGHAVLANIGARIVPDAECVGGQLVAGKRPVGVECDQDVQCSTGTCAIGFFGGTCGECKTDADCSGATPVCGVVGIAEAHLGLWNTCVAAAATPLNLACSVDAQCATGICTMGACSLCHDAADCGGGACEQKTYEAWQGPDEDPVAVKGASHCAAGTVATGGACIDGDDCGSGFCHGQMMSMCTTSWLPRRCSNEMDCPGYGFDGKPACVIVGISGGTCD